MCKLLITTCPLNRDEVRQLLIETSTKFETQRDGFGFAAFDEEGRRRAWGRYFPFYSGWGYGRYNDKDRIEVGKLPETTHTLLVHGRISTNVKGVNYCHPFRQNDSYLIHNGVLQWQGPDEERSNHPNDSGAFLEWLTAHNRPSKVWKKYWAGYGALAIMRGGEGGLEVVKCARANLVMAATRDKGYILSTLERDMPRWLEPSDGWPLNAGVIKFDKAGEISEVDKFPGFGERKWDWRMARSIGGR